MSSSFESMVNEMVRWSTTPESKAKQPEDASVESLLDDDELDLDDELDTEDDEVSPWPSSGRSSSPLHKKAGPGAA